MKQTPTYAQVERLHGWFGIPYEQLERLDFWKAKQLIGEVYSSNMSLEKMAEFRSRIKNLINKLPAAG